MAGAELFGLFGKLNAGEAGEFSPDEIGHYLPSVLAVTPAEAQGVAAELLAPQGSTMVIVGEAAQFIERLRREHPDVVVIPLAELNLDRPGLR